MPKEPQKLDYSMKPPKGYENTLDKKEQERNKRRELLNKYFNKIVKDKF
jgi:hypothetical protein